MTVNSNVRARLRDVSIVPDHAGQFLNASAVIGTSADDLAELLRAASKLRLLVNAHRFDLDSGC